MHFLNSPLENNSLLILWKWLLLGKSILCVLVCEDKFLSINTIGTMHHSVSQFTPYVSGVETVVVSARWREHVTPASLMKRDNMWWNLFSTGHKCQFTDIAVRWICLVCSLEAYKVQLVQILKVNTSDMSSLWVFKEHGRGCSGCTACLEWQVTRHLSSSQ